MKLSGLVTANAGRAGPVGGVEAVLEFCRADFWHADFPEPALRGF